jgi:hypothetical protein
MLPAATALRKAFSKARRQEQLEVHLRCEGNGFAAAILLGLGDGKPDTPDEVIGAISIGRSERESHRCGDHHARSPVDVDGLGKHDDDATGKLHDRVAVKAWHQQHELVVARARDHRLRT